MKKIGLIPAILWKTFFVIYFVVTMLVLYPLFYLFLSREQWFRYCFQLMRVWGRILLLGAGVAVSRKDLGGARPAPPYIICSNHSSYLDILIMYVLFDDYFVFMGKQELSKAPLFNIFFKSMNILVDRKSAVGAHKAFMRAGEDLKKGHCIAIFPEGTISKEAPKLRPFKNGLFKLAIDHQVPIIPVTFLNNYKLLPDTPYLKSGSRPGIAKVIIHPAIHTNGMTDEDLVSLRTRIFELTDKTLKDHGNRS
jgi:1-acyl-sn-glycerol-3-phosphate acyltransferase